MNTPRYNISDLEKLSGIKAHTIRIWEKRYGIINPARTETNIRFYTDADLQKILNISLLNRNGFKISVISQMSAEEIELEVSRISESAEGDVAQVNQLIQAALEMKGDDFERVLNASVVKLGFEEAFIQVVFPFLNKLGLLWQIGKISACQDSFVTNLVRNKLVVAIDGLVGQSHQDPDNFLLFLPADEYKELPLLFINYVVRKLGHKVVYLGPNNPLDHIRSLGSKDQFTKLVVSSGFVLDEKNIVGYAEKLSGLFDQIPIYMLLAAADKPNIPETPDHVFVTTDLIELISRLR